MKNNFNTLIIILTICLSFVACTTARSFKPDKDMKQISPLYSSMEIEVGQKVYYSANVHGSVGEQVNIWSQKDSILVLKDTQFTYDNPQKSNMPGGDSGTKFYIFEAIKPGESIITIEEIFRGETKKTYHIKIIVNAVGSAKIALINTSQDTVQLSPLNKKTTLRLEQIAIYSGNIQSSVDLGVKVTTENNDILKLIDTKIEYKNPQHENMNGGDAANKTFIFKAIKIGETVITIQEIYRGEKKNESMIVINVIE